MEPFFGEIRLALRFLRQRPVFAATAILSIAIGIGANTTIFSVVNALLLRPPAGIPQPDRVVEIGRTMHGRGFDTFSYPELLAMREQAKPLEAISGWVGASLSFSTGGEGQRVIGFVVSYNYFHIMGVQPALGRFFLPEEDANPGTHPVVVLSHRFWEQNLHGDPGVIGSTVGLNRRDFTVIGVAPAGFNGHIPEVQPDVYIPMMMEGVVHPGFNSFREPRSVWLDAVGRLAPGATVEQATAALQATFRHLADTDPQRYARGERSARAMPLGAVPGGGRRSVAAFLGMLMALVGVILLITCANVAGMLLARAAAREREIAIRLAIGAGRFRLVRQLVVESIVLFLIGGVAGVLLAIWAAQLLSSVHLPTPIPLHLDFRPDPLVLAFGLLLALGTGLAFGLIPALQSTRPGLIGALKNESRRESGRRGLLRRAFATGQVGLSLLLLAAAGLFLHSLQKAAHVDTGFSASGVQLVSFDLSIDGYDQARGSVFLQSVLERARQLPGAHGAALAQALPLDLSLNSAPAYPESWSARGPENDWLDAALNIVSDGYFETLRIRPLKGRTFNGQDVTGSLPVVVVSQALAEQAWPGEDPIGKRLRSDGENGPWLTVVGVVTNVKEQTLMEEPRVEVYLPVTQHYLPQMNLVVQSTAAGPVVADAMRRMLHELDPRLSTTPIQSLAEYTSIGLLPQRIAALVTTSLGLLALLLSALGVYGVVSYAVSQRTREIGIRMALGAHRPAVLRLILASALRLALPGLIIGMILALALSRVVRSFILGVTPVDPVTFLSVPLVLLAVVLLASWMPAHRAATVEPVQALRSE